MLNCTSMVEATSHKPNKCAGAEHVTLDPCSFFFSVPPGSIQRRQFLRSRVCSEEISGNRCSLEDLKGPGKQEAV